MCSPKKNSKQFWSKKIFSQKNWFQNILDPEKFEVRKFLGNKIFCVKINFGSEKFFESKKCDPKNSRS